MISARRMYIYKLHLTALSVVLVLTAVVAWLLRAGGTAQMARGVLLFGAVAVALEQLVIWVLVKQILTPTGVAASVAVRIADGDLSLPSWSADPARAPRDPLTRTIFRMLSKLRELVGAIRQHAHEAAAMAEQIAASTQQMTASTQEVARCSSACAAARWALRAALSEAADAAGRAARERSPSATGAQRDQAPWG